MNLIKMTVTRLVRRLSEKTAEIEGKLLIINDGV